MRPKVKIVDLCPGFDPRSSFLWKLMTKHFEAVWSEDPDYLVYSIFKPHEHALDARYDKCVKILWTAENVVPDFRTCDYALSFEHSNDPRNLRWPYYAEVLRWLDQRLGREDEDVSGQCLVRPADQDAKALLTSKTKFCNFVYSDPFPQTRIEFFKLLSKYKRVDSGGLVKNNLDHKVKDKLEFISDYKFTIAFENTSRDGYVTEKIVDPLAAHSVPIYWGNPRIAEDFNPTCFVNCHDYANLEKVVDRVIELDRDNILYTQYLGAPCFKKNQSNIYCRSDYLISFLAKIFADHAPRSAREPRTGVVRDNIDNWTTYL